MFRWLFGFFLVPATLFAQNDSCDILIVNGRIIDGTGNSWYNGNVSIRDGKIIAAGRDVMMPARKVVNAAGLIVAPGFIDVHTHLEGDETKDPLATNFILDGVTTCITGNCGSSNLDIAAYLRFIDSLGLSINVATLIGHNDVREKAIGKDARDPTPQEQRRMDSIVEAAMKNGAVGFSTGLIYTPGTYSKTPEIIELAKIAARYHGVYTTHMRDEGDSVTEAIGEALQVAAAANIPLEISHFKLSGQQNWGRSKVTVPMIENARKQGIDVTIDQYPYTASSTSISTLMPDEVLANGQDSINARLSRPAVRKYVTAYILAKLKKRKLTHLSYAVIANYETDTSYNGKSIEQVNLMLGRKHTAASEAETVMDMMMHGGASAVFHGMSEEDVRRIMKYPYDMFASDASIRQFGTGVPHPRGYGTNARVLAEYVRTQHVISLEDAIRRMTSLPAQKFGLHDRGIIAPGYAADVVIFDAATVQDRSTYEHPHAYSTGFMTVIVNGRLTVDGGKHLGTRAGHALYGPGVTTRH